MRKYIGKIKNESKEKEYRRKLTIMSWYLKMKHSQMPDSHIINRGR
jgi:hypothetical protein